MTVYGMIWRVLPGPAWVRLLLSVLLVVGVLAACFVWLFPWVATVMPFNDQTVGSHP